jgi:hypothetical protein
MDRSAQIPRGASMGMNAVNTKPQLILFGTDSRLLEELKLSSAKMPYISYEVGHGPQVTERADIDAFWATPMVGTELFGANPPFPLHEAQVYKTPAAQLQRGFPRYGIVGVAISPNDPQTPEWNLRLVLTTLLKAVEAFNSKNKDQITRVGILPEDLSLKTLDPAIAFQLIRELYEQG